MARTGSSKDKTLLSIVFSFKNEEDVIPELVSRVRNTLDQVIEQKKISAYEMVFVNDASTDGSRELLMEMSKGKNDIRIINMARNFGVSPCVIAGMEYAAGDIVVYMDADLQDPPELIPELIDRWIQGADVVHTVRLSRAGESRIKLLVTRIGYRILRIFSSIRLLENAGDFKLLSRRAVNEVIRLQEKRPFMRGLVTWVGFNQDTFYYNREARGAGDTKFPIFSMSVIQNFLGSALISFSDAPLMLFVFLGMIVSFSSFLYIPYLGIKFMMGYDINDNWLLIAALFFLSGIQLLGIGILGLYISSIFLEVKNRPNYIVESTFGFPKKGK